MPKRSHEDSLETRKKILKSAQRLFSRRGYERTSLSDVAKFAGVTRGAIYWHFESKEDLLLALLNSLAKEIFADQILYEASSIDEPDPLGKLKKSLLVMMQDESIAFFNSTFMTMLVSIINGHSGNEQLRDSIIKQNNDHRSKQVKALKNAIRRGQMPSNLIVESAVEHLGIFLIGYIHSCRLGKIERIKSDFPYYLDLEFETIKQLTTDNLSIAKHKN